MKNIILLAADPATAPTTIPGFDPITYIQSLGLTAGQWFGVAIAAGLGASVLIALALMAVRKFRKSVSQ